MSSSVGIPKIVFTGGPGGGKSTILAEMLRELPKGGLCPLVVPEAATILIGSGVDLRKHRQWAEGQLLALQKDLRSRYEQIAVALQKAVPKQKVILLFDRAEMDSLAFISEQAMQQFLDANNWSVASCRDDYVGVLHLVSADAHDYTTANNQARIETADEALALDKAIQKAWLGHEHQIIIGSTANIEDKSKQVLLAIHSLLGDEEHEWRWLINELPAFSASGREILADGSPVAKILIRQWYRQLANGRQQRLRRQEVIAASGLAKDHGVSWVLTEKQDLTGTTRQEINSSIDENQAQDWLRQHQPSHMIEKLRHKIIYHNQIIELDVFANNLAGLMIAEIESAVVDAPVDLPSWLAVNKEITSLGVYRNHNLIKLSAAEGRSLVEQARLATSS